MALNIEKSGSAEQQLEDAGLKYDMKTEANEDSHHKTPLEKGLVRKADLLFTPLMALAYLLAYLDRNNIGNARLMGFQKATHMSNSQFYSCVMIFCSSAIPLP